MLLRMMRSIFFCKALLTCVRVAPYYLLVVYTICSSFSSSISSSISVIISGSSSIIVKYCSKYHPVRKYMQRFIQLPGICFPTTTKFGIPPMPFLIPTIFLVLIIVFPSPLFLLLCTIFGSYHCVPPYFYCFFTW